MDSTSKPVTYLCLTETERITVRGYDLTSELMGVRSFTETFWILLTGKVPTEQQTRLIDAVLVALMEHGLTPQAIAARMISWCEPEAMQAAVAAGLLGIGSRFGGSMSAAAVLLTEITESQDKQTVARSIVERFRKSRRSIPGFGHPQHHPDDPRSLRLFEIARESKVAGRHVDAILLLSREVDLAFGRHVTINTTGAIAAVLGDLGVPDAIMRGFAIVSRSAGLVAHLKEEEGQKTAPYLMQVATDDVRYVDTQESENLR